MIQNGDFVVSFTRMLTKLLNITITMNAEIKFNLTISHLRLVFSICSNIQFSWFKHCEKDSHGHNDNSKK